jgi:hypothetical protein
MVTYFAAPVPGLLIPAAVPAVPGIPSVCNSSPVIDWPFPHVTPQDNCLALLIINTGI